MKRLLQSEVFWKQSSHVHKSSYLFWWILSPLRWLTQTTSSCCGGDSCPACCPRDLKGALADHDSLATFDPGQTSYFLPTAENYYEIHQEGFGDCRSMLHSSVWCHSQLDKVRLTLTSSRWGLSHLSLSVRGLTTVSHWSNEKESPGQLETVVLNIPVKQWHNFRNHETL